MSKPKTRNNYRNSFDGLSVDAMEPDETVASHATGATAHKHNTRHSPARADSTPSVERVKNSILEAFAIIDKAPSKAEWWTTLSTRLRDVLSPALDDATALAQKHLPGLSFSGVQEATEKSISFAVHDDVPGPTSPDLSLQSAFCPPPLTVHDVERAVARVLPDLLKSTLARELQDIRDRIPTGQNDSGSDARWPRADHCCSPSQHPHLPPQPQPHLTERDVFVSLAKVPPADAAHALSELEVKVLVDTKLARPASTGTPRPAVHGVKRLANGTLRIRTTSVDVRDALINTPDSWLPALGKGAQLARERFAVEVRAVPVTFRPDEACAIQAVYQANADVLPSPTSIVNMRWLREPAHDKHTLSLVVELDSLEAASKVFYFGIAIRGCTCDAVPFIPSPLQCYYCQAWGHSVNACPRKKNDLPITCARCAGPHATSACSCPHHPRCSSLRACAHIAVKCANCGGRHKTFSVDCLSRRRAAAEIARQPRYARILAAYSSSPHSGAVPASDTYRSLPFSGSPRARG